MREAISDEQVAVRLHAAFQNTLFGSTTSDGTNITLLRSRLGCSFAQLKRVIRNRPTQFALYNSRGQQFVVYLMASSAGAFTDANDAPAADTSAWGDFYCPTCNLNFTNMDSLRSHLSGSKHRTAVLVQQLRSSGSISANQQGICISEPPELQALKTQEARLFNLVIENQGSSAKTLHRVYQMRPLSEFQVLLDLPIQGWQLHPGQQLQVPVEVVPRHLGILCTLIVFDFGGFLISREVRAECDPFTDLPDISATSPYTKQRTKLPVAPTNNYEPGEREQRDRTPFLRPPQGHQVPNRLRTLMAEGRTEELQRELDRFKGKNDIYSHLSKMHLLLHLEELQQEIDVRSYDLERVKLSRNSGGFLALEVPGLAEARPSVMRGDALYVTPADGSSNGKEWEGVVHHVQEKQVLLRFSSQFHDKFIPGRKYNVRFSIKRTSFKFMHEALDVAQRGVVAGARPELLLPPATATPVEGNGHKVKYWANRNITNNPEQMTAVECIVSGTSGKLPYIIWGPPGTGKTSTLVEAAVQVLQLQPNARLLLVAPSNLAADLLALRLLATGRPDSEIKRVCAFARAEEDLPAELKGITYWDDRLQAFRLPTLDEITASWIRVVVVTPLMAAKLHAVGVPSDHFSHIMMDEAGHAEEPLTLCALAGLSGPETQVVLAGDPKQLGPVIHSSIAGQAGLRTSLLDRLATAAPYAAAEKRATAVAGLIVKLVRNYRSHPMLLHLPSRLFYGGELQACANPELTDTLLHWDKLKNARMPALFHHVVGKDEREANSPSWFNVLEAKQVLLYITELMALRRNRVTAGQIAVITPYKKQVQKIRKLLEGKGLGAVQVGSVEQLQGQERRVVIISTVRSSSEFLDHDCKHRLGFVASPKRFNVAITRAQALLIVVGNPVVLKNDPNWRAFMQQCKDFGAVAGQAMPDLSTDSSINEGSSSSGTDSSMARLLEKLEGLMSSLRLGDAVDAAADYGGLSFSGLTAEVGAGMVRHE